MPNLSPSQMALKLEREYLVSKWRRSALASYEQGLQIEDPGHGYDEISPIFESDRTFDVSKEGPHMLPFRPADLRDHSEGSVHVNGTGFLVLRSDKMGEAEVETPGAQPEMGQDHGLEIYIVTPGGRGGALATAYAGVLAMLCRFAYFTPGQAGIHSVRNLAPPSDTPAFQHSDETWRWDLFNVTFRIRYRGYVAQAA